MNFKKFETMIKGLELKARNWKNVVEYDGRQMNQGAMLIEVLRARVALEIYGES